MTGVMTITDISLWKSVENSVPKIVSTFPKEDSGSERWYFDHKTHLEVAQVSKYSCL